MISLLKKGHILKTVRSGQPCTIQEFIGGGGQGEVYRATWDNHNFAVKWYFPHAATGEQRNALEKLVTIHKQPTMQFLWPLDIVTSQQLPGFGYVMRLRERRFHGLIDLMLNRVDPSFSSLVIAGLNLADSFFRLHAEGLCYRDISFGNVFFDPQTGEVLVCDNDNVTENRSKCCGVLGTPDFMAPEIVRGRAVPDRQTDLYSLAVLLFYMFHVNHPLLGRRVLAVRCWDLPARVKLCGTEPLFIFHPTDKSNEAVSEAVDPTGEAGASAVKYWPIFPQFFRDTFTKAFTAGLSDPDGRVMEGEWRLVLSRLRDSIFRCTHCGKENFFDDEQVVPRLCPFCKKSPELPCRLQLGRTTIMLNPDSKLYAHHIEDNSAYDFSKESAKIVRHPQNPNIWGLRNLTAEKWTITTAEGATRDVDPGRSVPIANGTRIHFPSRDGLLISKTF